MGILYQCKVYNCYSLNVRSGPATSFAAVAWLQRDDVVNVDGETNGWYKLQGKEQYCNKNYLKIVKNLSSTTPVASTQIPEQPVLKSNAVSSAYSSIGGQPIAVTPSQNDNIPAASNAASDQKKALVHSDAHSNSDNGVQSSITNLMKAIGSAPVGRYVTIGNQYYPKKAYVKSGIPVYNWYMNHSEKIGGVSLTDILAQIEVNMNIPSVMSREEINRNYHVNFNRFRIDYPDIYLKNTMAVLVFTRPDLNIFDSNGNKTVMVAADPRSNMIVDKNKFAAQMLTARGPDNTSHMFNPLLSNMAQSLEIQDDSIEILDTGETFTGYKMQYSKHNIKSITAGTLSVKYKETFDTAITDTHQLWVDYMSNVYMGIFEPKRQYITDKILDYACDLYYFLLDQDGETIKFWSKYYGVFPNNVPKSTFSFDAGSQVQFPELNVTYTYIYKEDLSPVALTEFNENAGNVSKHVSTFNTKIGLSGPTWVGTPFVYSFEYSKGLQSGIHGLKLGWKKAN